MRLPDDIFTPPSAVEYEPLMRHESGTLNRGVHWVQQLERLLGGRQSGQKATTDFSVCWTHPAALLRGQDGQLWTADRWISPLLSWSLCYYCRYFHGRVGKGDSSKTPCLWRSMDVLQRHLREGHLRKLQASTETPKWVSALIYEIFNLK